MSYWFLSMKWAFPKQRRSCFCVVVSIYIINNCPFLFYFLYDLNSILHSPKTNNKRKKINFSIFSVFQVSTHNSISFYSLMYYNFFHSHNTAATLIFNYIDFDFDNISKLKKETKILSLFKINGF